MPKAKAAPAAPPSREQMLQAAINYACAVPADGIGWLRLFNAGDFDAEAELLTWMGSKQ